MFQLDTWPRVVFAVAILGAIVALGALGEHVLATGLAGLLAGAAATRGER